MEQKDDSHGYKSSSRPGIRLWLRLVTVIFGGSPVWNSLGPLNSKLLLNVPTSLQRIAIANRIDSQFLNGMFNSTITFFGHELWNSRYCTLTHNGPNNPVSMLVAPASSPTSLKVCSPKSPPSLPLWFWTCLDTTDGLEFMLLVRLLLAPHWHSSHVFFWSLLFHTIHCLPHLPLTESKNNSGFCSLKVFKNSTVQIANPWARI